MRKKLRACSSSPIRQVTTRKVIPKILYLLFFFQKKSPKFLEPEPFVPFSQRAQSYTSLRKPAGGKLTGPGEDTKHSASKESPTLIEYKTGGRKHANMDKQIVNDAEQRRALAVENCKDMKKDMKSILLWQIKGIQEGSLDSLSEVPLENLNSRAKDVRLTEEKHNSKTSNIHVHTAPAFLPPALPSGIVKEIGQDLPYSNGVKEMDALGRKIYNTDNVMFSSENALHLPATTENKKTIIIEPKAPYKLETVKTMNTTMDIGSNNISTTLSANLTERKYKETNRSLALSLSCPLDQSSARPSDKVNEMKQDLPYPNGVSQVDALGGKINKTENEMYTSANALPLSETFSSGPRPSEDKKKNLLESTVPYKFEPVKTVSNTNNASINDSSTLMENLTERTIKSSNKSLPLFLSGPSDKPNKMKHLKDTSVEHKNVGEDDCADFPPPPPPEDTPAPMEYMSRDIFSPPPPPPEDIPAPVEYMSRDIFSPPPPPPPAPVAPLSSSINLPSSASCLALAHKLKTKLRTKSEDRKQELDKKDEEMKIKLEAKDKEIRIMLMQKENEYENKIKDLNSMLENNMNVVLKDLKSKLEKKVIELKHQISAKDEELTKSVNHISNEYERNIDMLTSKLESLEKELMNKKAELKNKEAQAVNLSVQVLKCSSFQEKTISELGVKLVEADGKIKSLESKALLTDKEQSLLLKKTNDLETEARLKDLKIAALERKTEELRSSAKNMGNSNNQITSVEHTNSDQADSLLARLKPEVKIIPCMTLYCLCSGSQPDGHEVI